MNSIASRDNPNVAKLCGQRRELFQGPLLILGERTSTEGRPGGAQDRDKPLEAAGKKKGKSSGTIPKMNCEPKKGKLRLGAGCYFC